MSMVDGRCTVGPQATLPKREQARLLILLHPRLSSIDYSRYINIGVISTCANTCLDPHEASQLRRHHDCQNLH